MSSKSIAAEDQLKLKPSLVDAESFYELLKAMKVPRRSWDAVAFTDGSGTTKEHPAGYAATIVFRRISTIKTIAGSVTHGTSQSAEVRAVYELVNFLVRNKAGQRSGGFNLYLVSDSRYVVDALLSIAEDPVRAIRMKSHTLQWIGIQYASRVGINILPTYINRNSNPLMSLVDHISRDMRLAVPTEDISRREVDALNDCETEFPITRKR